MSYTEGKENVFSIYPAKGQLSLIPEKRAYSVEMRGYQKTALDNVKVFADDALLVETVLSYDAKKQAMIINIPDLYVTKQIKIVVDSRYVALTNQVEERFFNFLNQAEIEFNLKDALYCLIQREKTVPVLIGEMNSMNLNQDLYGALLEIITAR